MISYTEHLFRVDHSESGVWRYSPILPPIQTKVSLGEGLTPVTRIGDVFVKNERFNPTGSYSDRASAVIASYIKSSRGIGGAVTIPYVRDFTRSLVYYLETLGYKARVYPQRLLDVELEDLMFFASREVELVGVVSPNDLFIDYVNPLTVEGLKTIVFEVYENRLPVERVVVPAETGLLAISMLKGLMDIGGDGGDVYEVIAVAIKGFDIPLLHGVKGVRVVEVQESEVYGAFRRLMARGVKTKPLAALSFYIAEALGKAVAVITMGYRSAPSTVRSPVKKLVLEILSRKGPLTAYDIWKEKPVYTLRAVYKAVKDMEMRGEICFSIASRGRRRVKLYRVCG